MDAWAALAEWEDILVLDQRTVQLGAEDRAVRIIGPAQQTLRRLQERVSSPSEEAVENDGAAQLPDTTAPRAPVPPGDGPAVRVRARRGLAAVLIDGLPRPAALLAEQLTLLKLGALLLHDEHPVDRHDVSSGYPAAAVGHSRASAVRRLCLRQDPEAVVLLCSVATAPATPPATAATATPATQAPATPAPATRPAASRPQEPVDIHVIFARRAVAPSRLLDAAATAQLVLPVVQERGQWRIGPLLSRAHGPCPRCLLLHGRAEDPYWEAVQTALATSSAPPRNPTPTLATLGASPLVESPTSGAPQCAAVLASLITREIQLAIDAEFTPQTATRVITVSTQTGQLDLHPVQPHPECDCRLHATD